MSKSQVPEAKPRSEAKIGRSVILLGAALALVVVLTFNLFDRPANGNDLTYRQLHTPETKAFHLLRQGWDLHEHGNNPDRVKRIFAEARRLAPRNPDVLQSCGQMALINNEFEQALEFYTQCRKYSSKSRRSYAGMAQSLLQLERLDEAEAVAHEAVKAYNLQNDLEFQLILACIYQKMGKNDLAEIMLRGAANGNRGGLIMKVARTQSWAAPLVDIDGFDKLEETKAPTASKATEK